MAQQGSGGQRPIRVALMNDYEVVVQGLRAMLAPYADRLDVVELDSQLPVISDVDVVLYDGFSHERVVGPMRSLVEECEAPVVVYSWHAERDLVDEALEHGVVAVVSKAVSADELVTALEQVAGGATGLRPDHGLEGEPNEGDWPGRAEGLTARQSEVLALIAQGLSNEEVAERAYITVNSLKSHVRAVYRKIGAESRSQAVLWALSHGFRPSQTRSIFRD
jgi:NarL family two-component system response regulator LiaR